MRCETAAYHNRVKLQKGEGMANVTSSILLCAASVWCGVFTWVKYNLKLKSVAQKTNIGVI